MGHKPENRYSFTIATPNTSHEQFRRLRPWVPRVLLDKGDVISSHSHQWTMPHKAKTNWNIDGRVRQHYDFKLCSDSQEPLVWNQVQKGEGSSKIDEGNASSYSVTDRRQHAGNGRTRKASRNLYSIADLTHQDEEDTVWVMNSV